MLTTCAKYTPNGQCLYCNERDLFGSCTEYTTVDPATQIIPNALKTFIKCMIENMVVLVFDIESCALLGLQDLIIKGV